MSWADNLEPPYLNVAAYPGSPLRVLAGPGTGKTFAIMRRVSRLLEQGENPKDIFLVTFTRMAAKELVRKVSELGAEGGEDVIATTLHSFSFSMLQREQVIEATNRTPRTLLKFEMDPLLHDLKNQDLGGIRDLRKNITAYESAWARLQHEEAGWAQSDEEKNFEKILISWLKFHESMLIGELIPIALQYLRDNSASPYRKKFKHVIVDEYQDLNKAEQVLIDLLAERAKLSIVGDDDQSIYAFKYAHPEGIITFDSSHSNTHDVVLTECRRCPKVIVRIANKLIENNNTRYQKTLLEKNDNIDGELSLIQWRGLKKEAEGIAKIVKYYLEKEGFSLGEVLILAQRKEIADTISEELQRLNLKSVNYYNDNLLNNKIAQERFTLLNLIANPEDRIALRYWLGRENVNWHAKPYSMLREHCERSGDSTHEALEKMRNGKLHLNGCEPLMEQYSELIRNEADIKDKVGRELVDRLFPEGMEECSQLRKVALGLVEKDTTSVELLEKLREEIIYPEIPFQRNEVSIMSLHKAKGLEADLVIIPACVEGLIPSMDRERTTVDQQRELEENRRLFYVGITRTKKTLILSSFLWMKIGIAKQMKIQHTISNNLAKVQTSRFIRELGHNCPTPITGDNFIQERCTHD